VILAAGLTPAWQQILVFDRFETGQVNRARQAYWCASGKVLNVGRGLFHLDANGRTVSLVGGATGKLIQEEFAASGIPACWVESASPTRVCTTILDRRLGTVTELVENTPAATPRELDLFTQAFAEVARVADVVVLTGSLPDGAPTTYYRELLEKTVARVILDVRGPELLAALELRPWLVKPNREELARTVGRDLSEDCELVAAMREFNRRGAEWVVVTHGSDAVWATTAGKTYRLQPPTVPAVNPIGCGDAMCAGIAWSIERGDDPLIALRMGMAAAAENLAALFPCRLDPHRIALRGPAVQVENITAPADPTGGP
jgi:1-phosphofructokinase family hexose kinase